MKRFPDPTPLPKVLPPLPRPGTLHDVFRIAFRRLRSHPPSRSFVLGALLGALAMTTPLGRHVRDGRAALAASLRTLKHESAPAVAGEPCLRSPRVAAVATTTDDR